MTLATTLDHPKNTEIAAAIDELHKRLCARLEKTYEGYEVFQIAPTVQTIPGREAVRITVTLLAYPGQVRQPAGQGSVSSTLDASPPYSQP